MPPAASLAGPPVDAKYRIAFSLTCLTNIMPALAEGTPEKNLLTFDRSRMNKPEIKVFPKSLVTAKHWEAQFKVLLSRLVTQPGHVCLEQGGC